MIAGLSGLFVEGQRFLKDGHFRARINLVQSNPVSPRDDFSPKPDAITACSGSEGLIQQVGVGAGQGEVKGCRPVPRAASRLNSWSSTHR